MPNLSVISNKSIDIIIQYEGFIATKSLIGNDKEEDIGYGYELVTPEGTIFNERRYWTDGGKQIDLFTMAITEPQARRLLLDSLAERIPGVDLGIKKKLNSLIKEGVIQTQNQCDAMTSLIYATGPSEENSKLLRSVCYVLRNYKSDYYAGKDDIFTNGFNINYSRYVRNGLNGANKRRKAEYDLFFNGLGPKDEEQTDNGTDNNDQQNGSGDGSNEDKIKAQFITGQHDTIVIFDPTISLEEIKIFNRGDSDGSEITEQKAGATSPIVKINDMLFQNTDIQDFHLSYTKVIPELSVWINDSSGFFTSQKTIPKDGDIISIYIKSEVKDIKPIRQDFRIINVSRMGGGDQNGDNGTYIMSAILHVDINTPKDEYYEDDSNKVMQSVARNLKLGFATNDLSPDDTMVWIRPMKGALWFIEHVIEKSYKNDDTFFYCFIDQWYYMNFIEVNKKINAKELDTGSIAYLSNTDYANDDPSQTDKLIKSELFLSNSPVVQSTAMHIADFKPFNNTGEFWATNGYIKELLYYRKDEKLDTQYTMETLIGKPEDGEKTLRGREDEDHTTVKKYVDCGIQMNSNVHKNYFHAEIQNKFNYDNTNKMGLKITTSFPNLNIHRYDTVPIFIFNTTNIIKADLEQQENITNKASDSNTNNLDKVLSGFYLIVDVIHVFSALSGKYCTEYTAVKREWNF